MPIKTKPYGYNDLELTQALRSLLENSHFSTHADMVKSLKKQGLKVSQPKISRLLNKMGVQWVSEGDSGYYRLPPEEMLIDPYDRLCHMVLDICHNESLIVIKTAPSAAQIIALMIDKNKDLPILGSVAGDDTVMVIPKSITETSKIYQKIRKVLLD